ncbi:MAG: sugar ABC transporter substrate-binding protein [Acidobacteria bacterium]|nr:sugar ABC transporter substrate-binding protein [Acidobacteriota bacterium]
MNFKTARILASVTLVGSVAAAMLPAVSGASTPTVKDSTFNTNFSTMKYLKSVVAKGSGSIAVILPDTVSSTRYTQFDAPYLKRAFKAAGLSPKQYMVQNAQGNPQTQYTDAQADIAKGAKVLVLDPLDSTTGAIIEAYAKARGVKVIDYDRLTLGGARSYYVSFNNVAVGTLIGKGLVSCVSAWGVANPTVFVMKGAPTDNNATLFAQGYNAVLATQKSYKLIPEGTGTWTPSVALTDFQGAYTANPGINAVVTPNDENAAPIIAYLQSKGLSPKKIPFTGQDATLTGFQNIISGYQCGTVYKPIWLEAQAAAALAIYLRAGIKVPAGLANGTATDTSATIASLKRVPAVLLTPTWVTAAMVQKTVIKDKVISAKALCTAQTPTVAGSTQPSFAADCKTYGIK